MSEGKAIEVLRKIFEGHGHYPPGLDQAVDEIISTLDKAGLEIVQKGTVEAAQNMADKNYALLQDALATNKALVETLEGVLVACEDAQTSYDKNGPQWTSPESNEEYESTSMVLAGYEELAEIIRAALPSKPNQQE